jgi:hypothetical protein
MQVKGNGSGRATRFEDVYLGFRICRRADEFVASPCGWCGEDLTADSLPVLRHRIWSWWYEIVPGVAPSPAPLPEMMAVGQGAAGPTGS